MKSSKCGNVPHRRLLAYCSHCMHGMGVGAGSGFHNRSCREPSGSMVEFLTRDRGAAGWSLTGVTALCP